jgi:hypothetical protein
MGGPGSGRRSGSSRRPGGKTISRGKWLPPKAKKGTLASWKKKAGGFKAPKIKKGTLKSWRNR